MMECSYDRVFSQFSLFKKESPNVSRSRERERVDGPQAKTGNKGGPVVVEVCYVFSSSPAILSIAFCSSAASFLLVKDVTSIAMPVTNII